MEEELVQVEEVSELQEVTSKRSIQVQEFQVESDQTKLNEESVINTSHSLNGEYILNEDVLGSMLQQSRQIVYDVCRGEVMSYLLEQKNGQVSNLNNNIRDIKAEYDNALEYELKPNVYQEEQNLIGMEMNLNRNETIINKLKSVLEDIEYNHSGIQKQKINLQQEYCAKAEALKTLLNKKKAILIEHNQKMNLLKNKTDLSNYLEKIMHLEDCLKLKFEQKNTKIERNMALENELQELKNRVTLQKDALNIEIKCVEEDKTRLFDKKVALKEADIMKDNYKKRLEALQTQINFLKESLHNKKTSRTDLCVLRETLIKYEEEIKHLENTNMNTQQKIESIEEILHSLQILKQKNYCNVAEKLKREQVLFVHTTDLSSLQDKHQIICNELKNEIQLSEKVKENYNICKNNLINKKKEFEMEIAQLAQCFEEHNINYEEVNKYKDSLLNKKESFIKENEELIKLKLSELDKCKTEVNEIQVEIDKTAQLVESTVTLNEKLKKDEALVLEEYNTKYARIFGVNNNDNVKGILKSPKKVTFEDIFSSGSEQTDSMVAHDFERINHMLSEDNSKKRKCSRLDSP